MTTYGFQLRFLLPEDGGINHDGKSLEILLPGIDRPVVLMPVFDERVKDGDYLAIKGTGFDAEDHAYLIGTRIKNALLIGCTTLRMGIDIGKDTVKSGAGEIVRSKARELGYELLNDVHGLCVYPETPPVKIASMKVGRGRGLMSATMFVDQLAKAYEANYGLSPKQSLALDIYHLSHFELSSRARLLTLVSVIECLCTRNLRSDKAIAHVQAFMKTASASSDLSDDEKQSLLNGLGNLRTESISKSCGNLVRRLLGKEAMETFHACYEVRSRMLHDGSAPDRNTMAKLVYEFENMVTDLLLVDITGYKRMLT